MGSKAIAVQDYYSNVCPSIWKEAPRWGIKVPPPADGFEPSRNRRGEGVFLEEGPAWTKAGMHPGECDSLRNYRYM